METLFHVVAVLAVLVGLFILAMIIAQGFFAGKPSDEEVEERIRLFLAREKHDV